MGIEISRREVLNNLIRFKDNLLEMQAKEKLGRHRVYRVLLNRKTGDMRFAQKIMSLEQHFPRKVKGSAEDWKEIQLIVEQTGTEPVHFEVTDIENHPLQSGDLEPLAWRIANETVEVLNIKAKEMHEVPPEMLPEEAVLQDLSSIHLAPQGERIEDLPGWIGSLSRVEAEKLLIDQPVGTFLLREGDRFASGVAFHLAVANSLPVYPYLITCVERGNKISERLLLQTEKGWLYYNDEPRLALYLFFRTAHQLLQQLGLRFPFSQLRQKK